MEKKQNYIWNILQYIFGFPEMGPALEGMYGSFNCCVLLYVCTNCAIIIIMNNLYILFFREKKSKQNKTKAKKKRTTCWKWNDDICDIFPYDTFYRLETVTKQKQKKHTEKIGFNYHIYQTPSVTTTTTTPFLEVQIFPSLINELYSLLYYSLPI